GSEQQVPSFVPQRRTGGGSRARAGQCRMVAFFETVGGAALIAFWIFHAALLAAGAGVWAAPGATTTSSTEATSSESILRWFMGCLLEKSRRPSRQALGISALQNRIQPERHLADVLEPLVRPEP